jgi:hypothetical protein
VPRRRQTSQLEKPQAGPCGFSVPTLIGTDDVPARSP